MDVVSQYVVFIHVFSSSFKVDVSNSIVENAFYFLYPMILEFESFDNFLYHLLWPLVAAEVWVELID